MNRKQYFAVSGFLLALMFLIPNIITYGINHESVYYGVRDGILSAIMWLSFPLIILFYVLAWLEPKEKK